jgi:hypothetical protein
MMEVCEAETLEKTKRVLLKMRLVDQVYNLRCLYLNMA